jgi:hypothetical protein
MMIVLHQRRHHEVRQPDRGAAGHPVKPVLLDLGLHRTVGILVPVRNQPVERYRIDHRAGQNMRADLRTLFHHDNPEIGVQLLKPDRGGEAQGPAPTITTSNSMDSRCDNSSMLMLSNALNKNVSNPVVHDFTARDNPGHSDPRSINPA